VKDLEAFCKKLEAMGIKLNVTYRKSEAFGLASRSRPIRGARQSS
jgi:hypothetical protein